jgi:hypothetical protein
LAGGVGRVRSQFLEFGDDYLHKPAPTDPIINAIDLYPHPHIRLHGFVGAGLCDRFRIILKSQSKPALTHQQPIDQTSPSQISTIDRTLSSMHYRYLLGDGRV